MKSKDIIKLAVKRKYKISLLSVFVSCMVFGFLGASPYLKNYEKTESLDSFYLETPIDITVPSPSKNQINDLLELDYIERVTPFYLSEMNVSYTPKLSKNLKVLMFDENVNLDGTPFRKGRLINGEDNSSGFKIDSFTAKSNNIKLGDTVSFVLNGRTISRNVNAIYENELENHYPFLIIDTEIRTILNEITFLPYSAAYVEFIDKSKIDSFIDTYVAYGLIRNREDFEGSESEYESHVNAILNASYKMQITNTYKKTHEIRNEINSIRNQMNTNIIVMIVTILLTFIIPFLSVTRADIIFGNGLIKKGLNKQSLKSYYNYGLYFYSGLYFVVSNLSLLLIYLLNVDIYNKLVFFSILGANLVLSIILTLLNKLMIGQRVKRGVK